MSGEGGDAGDADDDDDNDANVCVCVASHVRGIDARMDATVSLHSHRRGFVGVHYNTHSLAAVVPIPISKLFRI